METHPPATSLELTPSPYLSPRLPPPLSGWGGGKHPTGSGGYIPPPMATPYKQGG